MLAPAGNPRNSISFSCTTVLAHSSTMVPTLLALNLFKIVCRSNDKKSKQVQEIIKDFPIMQHCHTP